jgi:hypothetical protein
MRRIKITLLTLMAVASIAVVAVWAQNPHYKRGPTVVDNGFTATATGSLAGLGNGNVLVTLAFPNATGTTTCTSPGGNQSPGQNPGVPAPVSGSASFGSPKNGNLSFTVTTNPPANPTPQAAGCPNGNWSASFNDITFGTGTLCIRQDTDGDGTFETLVRCDTVTL